VRKKNPPPSFILCILVLLFSLTNLFFTLPNASTAEFPQASFTFSPAIPYVNESASFNASASKPGEGSIVLYSWNFGDNTTGTGIFLEKSFTVSANYTVTLTVTNNAGANDTTSKLITILPKPEVVSLDLYNQKGGQGQNQPSGDFTSGEVVELTALVTYNNESVEYKPVSFEVEDAMGEPVLYRSAMTDENGLAKINFTILAECLPNLFGTWTVFAVSTVSGQQASDTLTFKVFGPYLDIYTQQPEPYSGRGLNQPSDAFAPQQEVILYGEAHYTCQPIEYKFVAFEVKDPTGQTIDYRMGATNASGIAMVTFRLASNATFGIYTVFASVEIVGENASDTLTFRVGWITELLAVETVDLNGAGKTIFAKGEQIHFNITAENIAFTSKTVTFTVVARDAGNVPIGLIILQDWVISPGASVIFLVSVGIPEWAFTGLAAAYTSAYTDLPTAGGVPYCPEISTLFTIIP
jgi:PKD repeat protein